MAIFTPPSPPLLTTGGTTDTTVSPPHLSTSSTSLSIIIVIIVIASAIIVSAAIYLLLRFISRRCSSRNTSIRSVSDLSPNNVVSGNQNHNHDHNHQHVICFDNNSNSKRKAESSLPLFTFSSLTGNIAGGDCAVCLSKFEAADQLRLLPLCCHAFHVECIDAWLQSNQTCPLCRSTVNPTEADVLDKILSISDNRNRNNNNNSFRIEIGSISSRQPSINSNSGQRSYSLGSYEYVLDEGVEVPVESTHRTEISIDKDLPMQENLAGEIGGSGRFNWLRDYVDRVSVSISSRSQSFRGNSGRFFTGSSRRSEVVDDFEATHGRVGEEISELFRWLSGV